MFKELDQLPDDSIVNIDVEEKASNDSSSPNLIIKIEQKAATVPLTPASKRKLVDINLTELSAPSGAQIQGMINEAMATSSPRTACGSIPSVVFSSVGTTRNFELREPYSYDWNRHKITVARGFIYDRASIPAGLFLIATKDNVGDPGPLIHDYLYRYGGKLPATQVSPYREFSRLEADVLLHELMTKCGVKKARRDVVYAVVRAVSKRYWQGTENNY